MPPFISNIVTRKEGFSKAINRHGSYLICFALDDFNRNKKNCKYSKLAIFFLEVCSEPFVDAEDMAFY